MRPLKPVLLTLAALALDAMALPHGDLSVEPKEDENKWNLHETEEFWAPSWGLRHLSPMAAFALAQQPLRKKLNRVPKWANGTTQNYDARELGWVPYWELRQRTNELVFATDLWDFVEFRDDKNPPQLNWYSNGCTNSPNSPLGFPFFYACWRHDFAWTNFEDQWRFTGNARNAANEQFRRDLNRVCDKHTTWFLADGFCRLTAKIYAKAVRTFGGKEADRSEEDWLRRRAFPEEVEPQEDAEDLNWLWKRAAAPAAESGKARSDRELKEEEAILRQVEAEAREFEKSGGEPSEAQKKDWLLRVSAAAEHLESIEDKIAEWY